MDKMTVVIVAVCLIVLWFIFSAPAAILLNGLIKKYTKGDHEND